MTETWSFKISSELKNILGRDLITDANIAVLELVKNSYDAHSREVHISFEEDTLIIADNGKGMSVDDILKKWLLVAYSAKKDGTEDLSYRDNIKRKYAGAKGIGRLSCDRLGRFLTMTTKSKDDPHYIEVKIDWDEFDVDPHKEFSEIPVAHRLLSNSDLFSNQETGTVLRFSGLHDFWGRDEILKLKKSLEKLINPFSSSDEFEIIFHVPAELENDAENRAKAAQLRESWNTLSLPKQTEAVNLERTIINGPVVNTIADTLNLKTTRIDSTLKDGKITTKLTDRGTVIYEIEEIDKFNLLQDVTITLFYLNQQAKYNFSIMMGMPPVNYGSVFLFRNGFRIMPYGEYGDDSWGLDQRIQQGYNRFIGTRQVLGRVDVETDDTEAFKEVSSRDGGLIKTPSFEQLMEYFKTTHKRLERYVVGVLWGEAFLRREYFQNISDAKKLRGKLQDAEKQSVDIQHVVSNIGSRVDFLQLVKSLANDDTIKLLYYNEDLSNIVANVSDAEIIQAQMLEDFRKVASKTNDTQLLQGLSDFERQLDELRKKKEEAERAAAAAKERAAEADRIARKEREQKEKEAELRKKAEKERDALVLKNKYLDSARDTSQEVLDLMHAVSIASTDLISLLDIQFSLLSSSTLNKDKLYEGFQKIKIDADKIDTISKLITKANTSLLKEAKPVDLYEYICEYMNVFEKRYKFEFLKSTDSNLIKKIPIIGLSLVLMNLLSNSGKANAKQIKILFSSCGREVIVDFSDDGDGVDLNLFTPESIFEVGVTNRPGGSGIGLSTIRKVMETDLNGSVTFVGNGINGMPGATFRLTFK